MVMIASKVENALGISTCTLKSVQNKYIIFNIVWIRHTSFARHLRHDVPESHSGRKRWACGHVEAEKEKKKERMDD